MGIISFQAIRCALKFRASLMIYFAPRIQESTISQKPAQCGHGIPFAIPHLIRSTSKFENLNESYIQNHCVRVAWFSFSKVLRFDSDCWEILQIFQTLAAYISNPLPVFIHCVLTYPISWKLPSQDTGLLCANLINLVDCNSSLLLPQTFWLFCPTSQRYHPQIGIR